MKNSRKTILLAGLCALTMVFCVGCGEEKSSSSEGSSSSKATETATAATSESSADETSQTAAETQASTAPITTAEKITSADASNFKFMSSYPGLATIEIKSKDTGNSKGAGEFPLDITAVKGGYSVKVNTIDYQLAFDSVSYREFLDKAANSKKARNLSDGSMVYSIDKNNAKFNYLGETFTLLSYKLNPAGRGTCVFKGSDNKKYYIYNDLSPVLDFSTGVMYHPVVTKNSKNIKRHKKFKNGEFLFIPKSAIKNQTIKKLFKVKTANLGNPPFINVQFDKNGKIISVS